MEEISFDDWSERLDHFSGDNSVWLPAYGFPNHGDEEQDSLFLATAVISDGPDNPANISNGSTTFLVLETIFEENSDELDTSDTESVASSSEESSSCSSDDEDVASVIHISPDLSCEDSESERDVEVPKKRRKRELNPFRPRLASEDDDQQSSLSRSSSLLQFESLEKAIMEENSVVFKTSATEKPFVTDSSPPSFSSFSFDSLEHRADSPIKDSLEDTSSDEETSYFLDRNKLNLRQSRLRSYRSFDSLLHVVRPQKFSNLDEENDIVPELKQSTNIQSLMHTLKSSENLSEDSGFGGDSENKKSPVKETIFDQFDLKSPIKETIFEENFSGEEPEFVRFNDQLEEFDNEKSTIHEYENIKSPAKLTIFEDDFVKNGEIIENEKHPVSNFTDNMKFSTFGVKTSTNSTQKSKFSEISSSLASNFVENSSPPISYYGENTEPPKFTEKVSTSSSNYENLSSPPSNYENLSSPSSNCAEKSSSPPSNYENLSSPASNLSSPPSNNENLSSPSSNCAEKSSSPPSNYENLSSPASNLSSPPSNYENLSSPSSNLSSPPSNYVNNLSPPASNYTEKISSPSKLVENTKSSVMPNFDAKTKSPIKLTVNTKLSADEYGPACVVEEEGTQHPALTSTSCVASRLNIVASSPPPPSSVEEFQQLSSSEALDQTARYEPISIDIEDKPSALYHSAPSLIIAMSAKEPANEEIIQKIQVGGVPVASTSPKSSKSPSKFGTFFQRFSFRRKKKSQENLTIEDEAINSVEQVAAELSNLDQLDRKKTTGDRKKTTDDRKKTTEKEITDVRNDTTDCRNITGAPPPLPTSGPPKSRLLGIVGRKKPVAQAQSTPAPPAPQYTATPSEETYNQPQQKIDVPAVSSPAKNETKKASSLVNLGGMMNVVDIDINHDYGEVNDSNTLNCSAAAAEARAKSMEFLLDEENKAAILPPENELRKVSERQLSEHELRVQRSLQRLNVPEWYKNSANNSSFILKRTGSGSKPGGWQGLNSKTTSLSSLQQQSPSLRSKYSRETTATSPSPVVSPSPQERLSFSYAPFSRWSTSRLNSGPTSANTSPSGSTRSSFHYRQPYLGWRSQEKLLTSTPSHYRTPAERLAANILSKPPLPPTVNVQPPQHHNLTDTEVQSSIKEVTSAIVHYVKEKNLSPANTRPADLDRSPSPRGSKTRVWVESSFVGSRPIDSPQTPQITGDTESTNGYEKVDHSGDVLLGHPGYPGDMLQTTYIHNGATKIHSNAEESSVMKINYNLDIRQQHNINFNIDDTEFTNSSHENIADNVSDTSETNDELETVTRKPKLQEELTQLLENFGNSRPTSATIEDVLDSLLGLPSASRSPSPVVSPRGSTTYLNSGTSLQPPGRTSEQEESANAENAHSVVDTTLRRHSSGNLTNKPTKTSPQPAELKTRRVSFELEPLNLTREISLDSAPSEDTVKCRYSKCGRVATITEARKSYKTCHNCNSHVYCSRECRRAHWEKGHRKTCLHGRIGALCRRVVNSCKEHLPSLEALSKLARRGYLAHGRGCVKVFFSSPELAERFTNAVTSATINESLLPGDPCFIRWADLLPTEMGNEQYKEILRLCKSYNPDTRLTLYVAICVISEVPSSGAVKWERQLITRCSKVRLHKSYVATAVVQANINITRDMDNPETVILTPLKFSSTNKTRQREIAFTNIQRHLRQRGISLRKHFPEVYRKLCGYVESNDQFTPVTIYPKDSVTGRNFMCIIMPESDPEKLQNVPTDSSRVQTIDIGQEHDSY